MSFRSSAEYAENKAVESIGNNPKYFFSYVKKKSKVKSKIGPLEDKTGKLTGDKKQMAEILSEQYKECSVNLKASYHNSLPNR